MFFKFIIDSLSLIFSSYYEPIISVEKTLTSFLIVIFNLCSITYFIIFNTFCYTLKYDISYLLISLQARPELEFFVDLGCEQEQLLVK
jgi:hypothetical protein